jgi:CheY-like chemotaxis protein
LGTLSVGGGYDLVVVDINLPRMALSELRARLAAHMPSVPLILLHEPSASSSTEGDREVGRRVVAELRARKNASRVSSASSEDPELGLALAACDAFAASVKSAIAEHHQAGRDVVVSRDGKLVRLPPP